MRCISISLVLAAALCGCRTAPEPAATAPPGRGGAASDTVLPNEEWAVVAVCSGIDWLTLGHVENVLASDGIPSAAEGSVLHGIIVPLRAVGRARARLIAEQRPDVYTCWASDAQEAPTASIFLGWQRPAAGTVTTYGIPVAAALVRPSLDARVAAALGDQHVVDLVASLPLLDRVELWELPYLGDDGTWKRGAYLELRLVNAPGATQGRFDLYHEVWDGERRSPLGTCAMFQGGSGAGPALARPIHECHAPERSRPPSSALRLLYETTAGNSQTRLDLDDLSSFTTTVDVRAIASAFSD